MNSGRSHAIGLSNSNYRTIYPRASSSFFLFFLSCLSRTMIFMTILEQCKQSSLRIDIFKLKIQSILVFFIFIRTDMKLSKYELVDPYYMLDFMDTLTTRNRCHFPKILFYSTETYKSEKEHFFYCMLNYF